MNREELRQKLYTASLTPIRDINNGIVNPSGSWGLSGEAMDRVIQLFDQALSSQAVLTEAEHFELNRLKTLEVRGIEDYREFLKGEAGSPERLAAWIHQLSPWNLHRGVEVLREQAVKHERELAGARIDELKHISGEPACYWWGERSPDRDIAMMIEERIAELETQLSTRQKESETK